MTEKKTEVEFDLSGLSVMIAMPCYRGTVPVEAVASLLQAQAMLRNMGVLTSFMYMAENALIDMCRNHIVHNFLKDCECQKLLFIDDDIIFKPEDLVRLVAYSTKYNVVAATYPSRTKEPTFYVNFLDNKPRCNDDGLMPIDGVGMGFVCIDRKLLEEIKPELETYVFKGETISRYFQIGVIEGKLRGEDMYFFNMLVHRFKKAVYLDPGIELQHWGHFNFDYKFTDYINKEFSNG